MGASLALGLSLLLWAAGSRAAAERPVAPLKGGTTEQKKADDVIPFDPKDYPRRGLLELLASQPCAGRSGTSELRDTLFSSELVYQGAVRKSPPARHALMAEWAKGIGDPGAEAKYKEEVSIADGGRVRWLAVPEGLLSFLRMDVQPGDRLLLYVVFVGCAGKEPLFAIDEFEGLDQRPEEAEDILIRLPWMPIGSDRKS